ncbi:MAG: penicillin-binding protein [Clostridia bacterium]|nr:penicillin-binding protein [Clostridia bacterium]
MKLLKKLLWLIIVGILLIGVFCFGYYYANTKSVELCPEKLLLSQKSVTLYDGNGNVATGLSTQVDGQTVRFEEIPKHTLQAFIDTEDKRFYTHSGFDEKRIVKAFLSNVKSRAFSQGASTISQQLVKNTHLSQEKTVKRKVKEWKLTKLLEKHYSKNEILEKYLNVIYFGHNCFGLRAAAAFYFNKTPQQLDLADSAILAGLVRSPNNYSPFKNPEKCTKRKNTVLRLMQKNGSIDENEAVIAIKKPLPTPSHTTKNRFGYAHYVFDELSSIAEEHGFTLGGKIEIYTYLDQDAQQRLENIIGAYDTSDKTALIADNESHGFKACVSSVGNVKRLPGSLLKPLLIYAPALEEDLVSPATPILDEPINYNGYKPKNFNGQFNGYTSVRECIAQSLNVPAVKLLESLGLKKGVSYLEKMCLDLEKDDLSLALALGGMKNGYTLKQLISAYSTLSNGGIYTDMHFIKKIKLEGRTVYSNTPKMQRVFSEDTAALTTDMLQTAAKTGTAKKLRALPFSIAAKTGTAGSESGNTDAYALSYTTKDVVGVWLGNAKGGFIESTGGGEPCNFLLKINDTLNDLYQTRNQSIKSFCLPRSVVRVNLDKTSYYDTHTLYLADKNAPPAYYFEEVFKKKLVPKKTSVFFTKPTINPPILNYENGKVHIVFDEDLPSVYSYKIERYDYATHSNYVRHSTLYFGEYTKEYTDNSIQKNRVYKYVVTPVYNNTFGEQIELPTVSTKYNTGKEEDATPKTPWWEY